MYAYASAAPAGEWIQWISANWIMLFVLLSMVGFLVLLLVLALAPDPPADDGGQDHGARRGREGPGRSG